MGIIMSGKKRKGMSLEEKRNKLLEMYYEKKEVLNLKEVEKFGAKKGIVLQSIKDVNQSLIDDNLVMTDKVGIGTFFWALPSQGLQSRKNLIEDYDKKIEAAKRETEEADKKAQEAKEARDGGVGSREQMQADLAEAIKKRSGLEVKLSQFERSDPKILQKITDDTKIAKNSINRWTDNLYLILQWIQQSKPGFTQKELESSFPIYRGLDYVE